MLAPSNVVLFVLLCQVTPRLSFPYFECAILLGGRLGEGLSNDVECYRSDTREFSSLKPLPFKKRNEFAACAIGDEIFVSGGLRSGEFWKYDPTFESWLRGASMIQPRRRHAMAAVDDTIFVLGGFDEDQVLDSVEVWERKSNKVRDNDDDDFCVTHVFTVEYSVRLRTN